MKLTLKSILFLVSTLLIVSTSFGQDALRTTDHRLESESLAEERTFTVQLPKSYEAYTSARYPVLYLLDGEANLAHAGPVTDFLAENGRIPEMIIVAVHSGATRSQDFMPPGAAQDGAATRAEAFLSFLDGELIPFVDAEYRTAPLRLASGHSLGGLFVTWAMASGSGMAHAWLAQSPYLVPPVAAPVLEELSDKGSGRESTETAPEGGTRSGPFYYANLGTEPDLKANFDLLETRLSDMDDAVISWSIDRHPSESHMSTRLIGLYEGLDAYFVDGWAIGTEELIAGGTEGLAAHVTGLSQRYGYPVRFSEQPFQELTQRFLQQRDMDSARKAAMLYVEHHDPSVTAHFLLGVAHASSGQREEGLAEIRRAMALYEADPDPALAPVYAQMQQLRQQLAN